MRSGTKLPRSLMTYERSIKVHASAVGEDNQALQIEEGEKGLQEGRLATVRP